MTAAPSPVLLLGVTDTISFRLMRGHPEHLAREGWDVHVVASHTDRHLPGATMHAISMQRNPAPLSDLRALISWTRLLRRLQPAVVMVGTPKAGLLGVVAAWLCRVPRRIYLLRGLRLEGSSGPMSWVLWLLELVACRLATDVLAVSQSLAAETVARRLVPPDRIHVLGRGSSNGVDVSEFRPPTNAERSDARQSARLPSDRVVVGFVGRVHEDKGVDTLVSAAVSPGLRDSVALFVVGGVESPVVAEKLERQLTCSTVPWIHVDHTEDVRSAYWAMDVLVLPSHREGFPNVVLEAAACGVPAIVTDATGCRDAVMHDETGWVFPVGDAESLASLLSAVAEGKHRLETAGESARQWALEFFDREKVWTRVDEYLVDGPPVKSSARRSGVRQED